MQLKRNLIKIGLFFFALTLGSRCLAFIPAALANPSLLRQSIIDYNLQSYDKSLPDGSYDGAAGVLLIGPEVARSFGLKAFLDENYSEARELNAKADLLFGKAVSAITTQEQERFAGEYSKTAGDLALASKDARRLARKHFLAYRLKVTPEIDDRLDRSACSELLDKLLKESLTKASFNLRDGLGIFYNRCQGLPENSPSLSPDNVRFVNHVFYEFTQKASDADKKPFDLGKQERSRGTNPGSSWKNIVKSEDPLFLPLVEQCLDRQNKAGYPVDPLLFIALMRRESNFDPRAVSYVGAAGLTQIMPATGKGLGMKNIYMPSYFQEAISLMGHERRLRQKAIALISEITEKNRVGNGELARELMQKSSNLGRKRSQLFGRYKKELLEKNRDDRLNPGKAIEYGYKYFSELMKMQKGDISLALSCYNAGPHRVKQYQGVPPYAETVTFRNIVLKYYQEYLMKLKIEEAAKRHKNWHIVKSTSSGLPLSRE
ncbi:MAG: transglycosylase SLT domain-containing protein [Proteobacteria bacterium]|nr:transglycosylase SLT domain-containing protein [Pseudomonadota bacterium]